jgi:hypothetical protein
MDSITVKTFLKSIIKSFITFLPLKEMAVVSLLIAFALCIVVMSLLIATWFHMTSDKTLDLASMISTSILGSGAIAIAAIELRKKSE